MSDNKREIMLDLDTQMDSPLLDDEELDWEPEYRCPNCDSMYDGHSCPNCGYNNY